MGPSGCDLKHFLTHDGELAPVIAGREGKHLCAIVSAVTRESSDAIRQVAVPCRRRPDRRACPGQIRGGFEDGSQAIRWECPVCGDAGWIRGWHRTKWDHGGRPTLPTIRAITYRRGLALRLRDRSSLPVLVLGPSEITRELLVAILDNRLMGVSGEFGDHSVGDPIQYDELTIEHADGADTTIVYNRAIMLFRSRDEFFARFHRVVCLIDRTERPNRARSR